MPGQSQKILFGFHPLEEHKSKAKSMAAIFAEIGDSDVDPIDPAIKIKPELVTTKNPKPQVIC